MKPIDRPADVVRPRDGWIALTWFGIYLAWLFWSLESEITHWLTMVVLPFLIALLAIPPGRRRLSLAFASVGLQRGNLRRGVGWALLAGLLITVFQMFYGSRGDAIQELFRNGRAWFLLPLTFVLMMLTAGFTEEFLFRGFLQTRLEKLLRSRWLAVIPTSLLFGVYHLPYAYFNPRWPSYGDWGDAWVAAMGNGVPGGLLLGSLYVISRGNLLACAVLHAAINASPAMTLIKFGGG